MIVVNAVAMAKDLDMHNHAEIHDMGQSCNSSVFECTAKTRIWQLLYVLEAMIGGPQGWSSASSECAHNADKQQDVMTSTSTSKLWI